MDKNLGHSAGQLNRTLHDIALAHLATLGHQVKETQIEEGYDINEEIEKFIWADTIIYQMPGWWMMMPWKVKSIWMKSILMVTANYMKTMDVLVMIQANNMVAGIVARVSNI